MFNKKEKTHFLNKKFLFTLLFLLLFGSVLIFSLLSYKDKKTLEKNEKIIETLTWGIEEFKSGAGFYPDSLYQLEEAEIFKPIDLLLGETDFFYKKTETGFLLKVKK